MPLGEISDILWRERRLLRLLMCKFEVETLLLTARGTKWLDVVVNEAEAIAQELRHLDLFRAACVQGVAEELGMSPFPTLYELAERSPVPWGTILSDHREELIRIARDVGVAATRSLQLRGRMHRAGSLVLAGMDHLELTSSRRDELVLVDE